MFGPIKHLVFDFDGTLVDSMTSVLAGLGACVSDVLGYEVSQEELLASFGPAPLDVLRFWLPEEKIDAAFKQWLDFEASTQPADFAPFVGIENMLADLKAAGYSLGIFTGRDRNGTLRIAAHHGWVGKYFTESEIICGDDGWRPKPHPDALLELLRRNKWAPQHSLMTGDHPYDMEAGRAAGTKTAAVVWDLPKTKSTQRAKFKKNWEKWDSIHSDLRLTEPAALVQWLVALRETP